MRIGLYLLSAFTFLLFPSFALSYPASRDTAIQQTMDALEDRGFSRITPQITSPPHNFSTTPFSYRQKVIDETLNDFEIKVGVKLGYITGDTTYDFNYHTSELMFPLDMWGAGGDFTFGYKGLSLNAEAWGSIVKESGSKMTDKDWDNGDLWSSTESKGDTDFAIFDVNLRYDFYHKAIPEDIDWLILKASDEIKLGAVAGYKYEQFYFDLYDLYDAIGQTMSYEGVRVGTYKIEYSIPYLGLALDVVRRNYGFNLGIKFPINATAEDLDNHLLRALTFYGDYESTNTAFMFNFSAFRQFKNNWIWNLGVDGTFLNLDGITWDETRNPAWDAEQSTDLEQVIVWSGLKYNF